MVQKSINKNKVIQKSKNKVKSEKNKVKFESKLGKKKVSKNTLKNQNLQQRNEETDGYYLLKSEGASRKENGVEMKFDIDDLIKCKNSTSQWDGVRNYEARKYLRMMKTGNLAFFYHSNCKNPGIAGIVEIVREAYTDVTQFDKNSLYFDGKATLEKPVWNCVDVKFVRKFEKPIFLENLRKHKELQSMQLFTRSRLSVQKVEKKHWNFIMQLD